MLITCICMCKLEEIMCEDLQGDCLQLASIIQTLYVHMCGSAIVENTSILYIIQHIYYVYYYLLDYIATVSFTLIPFHICKRGERDDMPSYQIFHLCL